MPAVSERPDSPEGSAEPAERGQRLAASDLEGPSLLLRTTLTILGVLLLALGVVGLFLPVLQGVLFLALGIATLSFANERFYRWVRSLLRRWPRLVARVRLLRGRLRNRFLRRDR